MGIQYVSPKKPPIKRQYVAEVFRRGRGGIKKITEKQALAGFGSLRPNKSAECWKNLEEKYKRKKLERQLGTKHPIPVGETPASDNHFSDDWLCNEGGFGDAGWFGDEVEHEHANSDSGFWEDIDDGESLESMPPRDRTETFESDNLGGKFSTRLGHRNTSKRTHCDNKEALQRNWDNFVLAVTGPFALKSSQSPLCGCSKTSITLPSISFSGTDNPHSLS